MSAEDSVIHEIVFDPFVEGTVYAATAEGFIRSIDNGLSWEDSSQGLPAGAAGKSIVHGLTGVQSGGSFVLFATLRTQSHEEFAVGGVWRNGDAGETWIDVTGDLPRVGEESELAYCYYRIVTHPTDPNTVYVGTRREGWAWDAMGVYRTGNAMAADGGSVEWEYLWDESAFTDFGWMEPGWWNDRHVGFLAISPTDPNVLFAGGDHLFRTNDGGATWTEAYAVAKGEDTWSGRGIELLVTFDVAVDPNDPDRWWIGYDDMGLWRTDDAGESFVRIDSSQSGPETGETDCAFTLVADLEDSDILYVGRNGGEVDASIDWAAGLVYKTMDSGKTWIRLGAGVLEGGRPQLLMLPGGDIASRTLLCAIYGKGLYRSSDSGSAWSRVDDAFSGHDRAHVWRLAGSRVEPDVVYAGITDASADGSERPGGIYRSFDGGLSWSKLVGATVPAGQILALSVDDDGVVYAGTTALYSWVTDEVEPAMLGGLYRSDDRGETWRRVLDQLRVDGVATPKGTPSVVVAAVSSYWNFHPSLNAGAHVSRDGGQTFQYESEGLSHTRVWFLKSDPSAPDRLFVGTGGGGLFVADWSGGPDGVEPGLLTLGPIEVIEDGRARIRVVGPSGRIVRIRRSRDLRNWLDVAEVDLLNGSGTVIDDGAVGLGSGYYQGVIDYPGRRELRLACPGLSYSGPLALQKKCWEEGWPVSNENQDP